MTDTALALDASIGDRYRWAAASFLGLVEGLGDDEWATTLPCTPAWSARDLLSHVAGITDDALNGRLDGVTTEPWTAAQVERNRGLSVAELCARWRSQIDPFADAIEAMGQHLPPFDCHTHEHDLRHALGRPGNRDNAVVTIAARGLIEGVGEPLVVEFDGAPSASSAAVGGVSDDAGDDPVVLRGVTEFEVFRSRVGRRSHAQVEAYDWTGSADRVEAVIDGWFTFGPADEDIVE